MFETCAEYGMPVPVAHAPGKFGCGAKRMRPTTCLLLLSTSSHNMSMHETDIQVWRNAVNLRAGFLLQHMSITRGEAPRNLESHRM